MKRITSGLKMKLIMLSLAVSLLPIGAVGAVSYVLVTRSLQKQLLDNFEAIGQSREQTLIIYLKEKQRRAAAFAKDRTIVGLLEKAEQGGLIPAKRSKISASI